MSKQWIKWWCNDDTDGLNLELTGAWAHLLRLAGRAEKEGHLAIGGVRFSNEQLAAVFRCTPRKASNILRKFVDLERIRVTPSGIEIINWRRYQSEYQRTKDAPSRIAHKSTAKSTAKSTEDSTADSTAPEREREKRIENRETPLPPNQPHNIFSLYEKTFGEMAPGGYNQEMMDATNNYPWGWIEDAFIETKKAGRKGWGYTQGILKNWIAEGRIKKGGRNDNGGEQTNKPRGRSRTDKPFDLKSWQAAERGEFPTS